MQNLDTTLPEDVSTPDTNTEDFSVTNTEQALIDYLSGSEEDEDNGTVDTQDDEESDEATSSNQDTAAIPTVKVKINGEEKEVTQDELVTHYQKAVAADKRFEEAANLRKEALAKQELFESTSSQLQNAIQHFTGIAQQWEANGLLQPPSPELLDTDPVTYLKLDAAYKGRMNEIHKAKAAQDFINEQSERTYREDLDRHLAEEAAKLHDFIPEWGNNKVKEKEQVQLVDYLTEKGYSQGDIEELSVSRASNIAMVVKAMRYDSALSKIPQNKIVQQPTKTISGQSTNIRNTTSSARQKFNKSGSVSDAAAVFSELFG
jgi:protein associated with RNAse G/E